MRRAIELERVGRHLLFAGDPVPAGEVLAVPSADQIDIAVCLLDAGEPAQTARLRARREPTELLPRHLAFTDWLRRHATDPMYAAQAVTTDAWPAIRWERWVGRDELADRWGMTVIATSSLHTRGVADALENRCHSALGAKVPVFRRGWHLPTSRS